MALAADDYWLDLYSGDEASEAAVAKDLRNAGVVYIGESHTIPRHHAIQLDILKSLAKSGRPLALGMEQLEARNQPEVDRFNRGELDFDGLAKAIDWQKQWGNYEQYRAICEFAQRSGIPIKGLNAPKDVIRAVGRGGLRSLSSEQRKQLPRSIELKDPVYEKLMNILLSVHASMDPKMLRSIFEAQVARDETMAQNIAEAYGDTKSPRTVVVLCGSGHVRFGLGTPDRVRRRLPDVQDRILLATESGQLKMSAKEKAMSRDTGLSHDDLREIARPLGDYLKVLPVR